MTSSRQGSSAGRRSTVNMKKLKYSGCSSTLSSPPEHVVQVPAALHRVLEGVRLGRVLLGLDDQPAAVVGPAERLEDRYEVDDAVTRHREHARLDRVREREALGVDPLDDLRA